MLPREGSLNRQSRVHVRGEAPVAAVWAGLLPTAVVAPKSAVGEGGAHRCRVAPVRHWPYIEETMNRASSLSPRTAFMVELLAFQGGGSSYTRPRQCRVMVGGVYGTSPPSWVEIARDSDYVLPIPRTAL